MKNGRKTTQAERIEIAQQTIAKKDNGQLTELEKKNLEIKHLKARPEYVSTEAPILNFRKQRGENAAQKTNIKPFNSSPKK